MKHTIFYTLLLSAFLLTSANVNAEELSPASPYCIIPAPSEIIVKEGCFTFGTNTDFIIIKSGNKQDAGQIEQLQNYAMSLPLGLKLSDSRKNSKLLIYIGDKYSGKLSSESPESYKLTVTEKSITIISPTVKGSFYAIQNLLMMTKAGETKALQCCEIEDSPRFSYRGLHFDVSRHFRSKEFLKKQIDAMALFKLNKMHLHLTDGAGWRLQIDAYPRLTEYAAWRPQRRWMDWWTADRSYCEGNAPYAYGGYYTKDDIREIISYAKSRHIEVIPEIEMPGHSEEVIAAYPELGCTGAQGASSDFCPGKESTFDFLETVLSEVIDLFPSEYIHIGGDEASKSHWVQCPDCQKRMKSEGLENVDQLQSYLIHRIEQFVNSKGRKIIGWDEILQGGLAPNATVMSWRGEEGGLEAARSGHDVIMTPSGYCYLDYTQDAPFKEPLSIGGYLPLSKVYSYEPSDSSLTPEQQNNIIGVQGNLWSEYIVEDSHAEYMYYPRALAISEIGWNTNLQKDYVNFRTRVMYSMELLTSLGYNVFSLDNEYGERRESLEKITHLAVGSKVKYTIPYHQNYPSSGESSLVDGVIGGWTYGDGRWQGFLGDMDLTIDLQSVKPVSYIGMTFMSLASAWVHLPQQVEITVSEDGETYNSLGVVYGDVSDNTQELLFKNYFKVSDCNARYIRIKAKGSARPGAWLFVDEIVVN